MSATRVENELPTAGLPTADELPCEDGETLETARHRDAMNLLIDSLNDHWADRDDFYAGGDMFLYFSPIQSFRNDFRGPDVFVALDVPRHDRKSWVAWEEGNRAPDLIVELTSDSTRRVDFGRKKHIYAQIGVQTYVLFDPFTYDFEFNVLEDGDYVVAEPNDAGRYPVPSMNLELGTWEGVYVFPAVWLRWFSPDGTLVPTGTERAAKAEGKTAEAEAKAAEAEAKAAEAEAKAEALAARLAEYEQQLGSIKD